MTSGPVVTLHIWRVPTGRLPQVLWRMARDRGRLRRTHGVHFAKLLGTGRQRTFGPRSADPTRWAALVVWANEAARAGFEAGPVVRRWRRLATAECRLTLRPISSRGRWSGREPFGAPAVARPSGATESGKPTGPADTARAGVAALTRARLRPTRAATFWRAIPSVAAALDGAPGLVTAFGIGETPLSRQGTVSLWRGAADLVEFAYRHPRHAEVISATPVQRWYAEELFSRFDVLEVTGDRSVIDWGEAAAEVGDTQQGSGPARLVRWQPDDLIRHLDEAIEVYGAAMGYPPELLQTRRGYVAAHTQRIGFRAVATLDPHGALLGFGYGYPGCNGQWWHDHVRAGLRREGRKRWLRDNFEVVEMHVRPDAQGHGLGARQLTELLTDLPHETVLLSTPEADEQASRAWRLYRRFGFEDVLRDFRFPGDDRPFAVLGRRLPL